MSFSQRRFIGFRNRLEFEKKRLIIASRHDYSILGYDHRNNVYGLLKGEVSDRSDEEIVFIDFLEDT